MKYRALGFLLMLGVLGSLAQPLLAAEKPVIETGRTVKLHYTMSADGKVLNKDKKNEVVQFVFGQDDLVPAFRKKIEGMRAGEKKSFELLPQEAFGVWDPGKARIFNRAELPTAKKLKPGMVLTATFPYTTEKLTGRITKIIGNDIGMDFNHPLAGKILRVDATIDAVS